MKIFFAIGCVILLLAVFFLGVGYQCFLSACKRKKRSKQINFSRYKPFEKEMEAAVKEYDTLRKETVCIDSFDGYKLCASYISADNDAKGLIIAFHGYHSSANAEFACIAPRLIKEGFSMILPDQRAHGKSEGEYIGFGALERKDCKSWCEYAANRFGADTNIYLYGVSMGGATVLMSADLELPANVRAIIADCPFTSPWAIIKNTLRHKHKIPPYPMIYFMNYWARQLAHFDFREISAIDCAKVSKYPTLYIHGKEDTFVPTYMSEQIFSCASDDCTLLLFDGARHARSCISSPERYSYELVRFLDKEGL